MNYRDGKCGVPNWQKWHRSGIGVAVNDLINIHVGALRQRAGSVRESVLDHKQRDTPSGCKVKGSYCCARLITLVEMIHHRVNVDVVVWATEKLCSKPTGKKVPQRSLVMGFMGAPVV